ncbi:hypothetical protein HBH82_064550 [Parastagonospora nodorum]|nr:hypothetical protein HBH82_064550 [Parastagonospora nodorum]KAH4711668.1 hypothetical protein HBH67_026180 [Parastagonospora nodorum]KAH4718769.1 hypothetical protein HBH78_030190 [Parastagonospora nodorum]KAH4786301.1 hypothetical protein HBH62_087180 [Parastagonospora nodorum]KAH4824303.1 hypothetical protein HBH63_038560 [Parastagonospora nodorum]
MAVPNRGPDTELSPRLHLASAIRADAALVNTLTTFINEGYRYLTPESATRWDGVYGGERLSQSHSIHDALGHDGMFAVIYDVHDSATPIACAAAKRWESDLDDYSAADEDGWEILMVATRVGWMRRGLAGRCVDALVAKLISQTREDEAREDGHAKVKIWIHAVEDLNGAYWQKKGWAVIRAYEKPAGHWGSILGYRLLVMPREFGLR